MKKRIASIVLCLAMCLTLLPAAALAAGRFADVKGTDWFYADVEYAVAQGLVNGTSATTYSPDSNLTYGSAIKLAACMHKKATQGNTDFTVGTPWYQVYVDYALANGIISAGRTYDWNANATRAGYMEIFANAIPDTGLKSGYAALTAINRVDDGAIPDVSIDHPQAAAIYKLYRAGILQGSNAVTHTCNPGSFIQRSEVATILTRMMSADARIRFEMAVAGDLVVTEQPADVDYLSANGKAVFSTVVTGGKGPYSYQWFESYDGGSSWNAIVNDSKLSGVVTNKLTVKLDPSEAYTGTLYRCRITDAAKHQVFTQSARVTADNSPLTVVEHPVDVTAGSGAEVWFSAFAVGGKLPHAYQWQRKASDGKWQDFPPRNSGYETSKSNMLELVTCDIDFAAGYSYRCKITDAAGVVVYTNAATLKKSANALTVTAQPQNVTCKVGDWVDFGVTVSGGKAPLIYQWQAKTDHDDWWDLSNGEYYTGTNTAELRTLIAEADFQDGNRYRCKITDSSGAVIYSGEAVPVRQSEGALTVTEQPQDEAHDAGEQATFKVAVTGGRAPYTYQWQMRYEGSADWSDLKDNAVVDGADTDELWIMVEQQDFDYGYQYRCKITDAKNNSVFSEAARVTNKNHGRPVTSVALTVTEQPQDETREAGEQATFKVAVTGGKAPYTYQWQLRNEGSTDWSNLSNNAVINGAKTNELWTVVDEQDFIYGYQYRCVITDAKGTVICSEAARILEKQSGSTGGLTITTQPKSTSADLGEKATFTVEVAGGKSPYSYQWQYSTDSGKTWMPVANSTKYGGVSRATFTVKIALSDTATQKLIYRCRISDATNTTVDTDNVIAVCRKPRTSR